SRGSSRWGRSVPPRPLERTTCGTARTGRRPRRLRSARRWNSPSADRQELAWWYYQVAASCLGESGNPPRVPRTPPVRRARYEERMAAERALAIVVRGTDWSETSRITTLFTREYGKVRALAKGGRRLKSNFDVAFDLLTVCQIMIIRKG